MRNWNLSTKIIVSYSVLIAVMARALASGMYWQLRSSQRQGILEEGVRSQNPGVRITFVGDSDPNEKVDTVQTMGF